MGFRGREINNSCSSTSPSMKKKHVAVQRDDDELPCARPISDVCQSESIRSRIKRMGPICTSRKKFVPVSSPLSTEEDVDFDKQLGKERFLSFAGDESMWLSSGCASPSSFFQEQESSCPFRLVADEELFVSWLSKLPDSYISFSKGATLLDNSSKLKPVEDESSALARPVSAADGDERIKFCCGTCSDESTNDDNCLTSLSTDVDSSSQVSDMDITSFMVSLLNLDEDGSQWISNTEFELNFSKSGFPSPSFKSIWGSEAKSNISATHNNEDETTDTEKISEAGNMKDFSTANEPLFWPYDKKIDWNSEETWKNFAMSPRKDIKTFSTPEGTSPRSTAPDLNNRNMNLPPNRCRRKLVLDSGSAASKFLEFKQGRKGCNKNNSNGGAKSRNTMPSRLRESTKDYAKMVPLDTENHVLPQTVKEIPIPESDSTSRKFWDDEFTSNEELPIETVLGLGEFDGHEGIDSGFDEDVFFLDEAL